jgi:hypothetical protein
MDTSDEPLHSLLFVLIFCQDHAVTASVSRELFHPYMHLQILKPALTSHNLSASGHSLMKPSF